MQSRSGQNDLTFSFLIHFLSAGSSALFLSIAHIHAEYWYISVFALVPFLWRLNRANLSGSVILGIILPGCYAFVAYSGEILIFPLTFLFKLFCLILIFSIFGIAVNRVKKYIGFNPIFIAALWLPLEYILTHYAGLGNIFVFTNSEAGFVLRFASLFGFLMVAFAIILVNSIILMFIEYIGEKVFGKNGYLLLREKNFYPGFKEIIFVRKLYYLPELRGPPKRLQAKLNRVQCAADILRLSAAHSE